MKKTTFKKAISMLLTFSLLFSIAVVFNVSASAQTSAKTVEIVSNNVYYGDTLKLMYAVKAENITSGDSVALKLYDKNGGELETITNYETQAVNGESCYVFTSANGVPAHKIDTEVYAKAIILNGAETVAESDMLKYSVLEYLYERLTVSKEKGKVSAEQEAMYEGLIEYACLAEKVLTNKTEADKIANYSYVYNANASGAEKGAIYKKGSTINGFSHNITNPEYTVIWQIDKYDKSGSFIDSEVLTDAALASSGYTVGEYNVVISARENAITEADVLSQISTFGNPSNFNVDGSTYGSRGCVRFSFPIKAGTTFKLKEEYRTKYKIAMNYTTNPEYKDTQKYPIYDLGWDADHVHTTAAAHDGLYPVVCFTHQSGGAFTRDEIEMLVTMLEVTGEKATVEASRGQLTKEEHDRQIGLFGSVPMPNVKTRQRIAYSIKMQKGTEVKFVGDSAVYNWAVVESSNTASVEYMFDTGWNSSWTNSAAPYYTQIDGSYIVLTVKRIDGADMTKSEIDALNSMFEVNGQKYYKTNTSETVKAVDYAVKSVNHRGYVSAPENTLEAYRLSFENGFKYVECDVSFTSDGYAVLLHDNTIDRTSNGTGAINSLTLAQVRTYDFGTWKSHDYAGAKIPTFEEFIALCVELDLHPYIELKSELTAEQAEQLVEIVEKYGLLDGCTWISFKDTSLAEIKNVDSGARLGYLVNEALTEEKINTAKTLRTENNEVFIDANYGLATAAGVELCKSNGFALEIWTVNKTATLDSMNEYVSGVTSDYIVAGKYIEDKKA
ncbi:MAG: hypothetical protein IJD79_10075 [Clostridia bacterium]|nr:hypothetical protein [Clostridia bacterium]